jgi:hypothetical protein
VRLLRRLYAASVWAPEGIPAGAWRFRGQFRFVFPYVDLMFLWFGIAGWQHGIRSVETATSNAWQTNWSLAIAVFAAVCLLGISFPKLWAVELLGKLFLIGLVCAYLALQLSLSWEDPKLQATAGLFTTLIAFPAWRVGDLGVIARQWWMARKQRGRER